MEKDPRSDSWAHKITGRAVSAFIESTGLVLGVVVMDMVSGTTRHAVSYVSMIFFISIFYFYTYMNGQAPLWIRGNPTRDVVVQIGIGLVLSWMFSVTID